MVFYYAVLIISGREDVFFINLFNCLLKPLTVDAIWHEEYLKYPMSMMERKMNMKIAKNSQLLNSLDRNKKASINQKIF